MTLNFVSDNESPAAPEILDAVIQANRGSATSYGEDHWSEQLDEAFSALFGIPTTAIPVSTGTAANSIALSCLTPPWGSVYCHSDAHAYCDESGAPEFFGHGLRIVGVEGADGKITPEKLHHALARDRDRGIHGYLPSSLSLTQSTEAGTVYRPDEIAALTAFAQENQLHTHMDGARFANAVAALDCTPAAASWKAGVKVLSFGASKNGCMAAEALLFFGESAWCEHARRARKRSGHLLSKMRYVSAQLLAYVHEGLWLRLAGHANQQAAQFAATVRQHPTAKLEFNVDANEVFVRWSEHGFKALRAAGIEFLMWPGHEGLGRFVFSHCTEEHETARLCEVLNRLN